MTKSGSLKKQAILLSLIVFTLISARAEIKSIKVVFNEDEFELTQNSGSQVEISSQLHNLMLPSDSTMATVPYVPVNVLMPAGAEFKSVSFQSNPVGIMNDVTLPPIPYNVLGYPQENVSVSNVGSNPNSTKDENLVKYTGSDFFRGYNVFHFLVRPFDYRAKSLYLNSEIGLNIDYTVIESSDIELPKREIDLSGFVINPEDAEIYYSHTKIKGNAPSDNDWMLQYAIITNKELAEPFKPLVDWKNMKGIHTEIFFVEDIYAQFPNESTNQMKIKRFIEKLYKERDVWYVLLGGCDSIVPAQQVVSYIQLKGEKDPTGEYIPSDLFYASLSAPFDWDGNKNGVPGELDDRVHFVPDVYVTRVPVTVANSVRNFVEKVINYERFPDIRNWKNDLVMSGKNMFESDEFDFCDGRGTEMRGDKVYEEYIKPYWNGKLMKLYQTHSDFKWKGFRPSSIKNVISDGHSFMNIFTHGDEAYIETYFEDLYGDEIFPLNNPLPTILTCGACNICNLITKHLSFGACVILSRTDNIVALYGCTGTSISQTNDYKLEIGGIPRFIGNFYKKMFTAKETHLGQVYADSKWDFIANCNEYNDSRWNMLSVNMFGDPEMPIYTCVPKEFGNVKVNIKPQGNKYEVSVNPLVDDYYIAFTKLENGNYKILKSSHVTYSNNTTSFTTDDKDITICITKEGYVPYVIVFNPKCLNLQNETFTEGCVFISPIIKLGNNVTPLKSKGDVVFKGNSRGKYTLRGRNINIGAGTVFEKGAEVKMDYTSF